VRVPRACGDSEDEAARTHLEGVESAVLLDKLGPQAPSSSGHITIPSLKEVAEAPQPRTVEAMCKTKWPAQGRPTETEVTVLTEQREPRYATRVLEGEATWEVVIMSPKGPRARIEGTGDVIVHCEDRSVLSQQSADLLDELGHQAPSGLGYESESMAGGRGAATTHGRGHVQDRVACTRATDRDGGQGPHGATQASHDGEGRHPNS
jgi:hypothetical protein